MRKLNWKLTWTLKPDEELRPKLSWRLEEPDRPPEEESPWRCCSGCSQTSPWSAPLLLPGSFHSASGSRARLRSFGRIGWIQRPLTGLEHNRHLYSRLEQKGQGLAGLLGPAPVWGSFIVTARMSDLGLFSPASSCSDHLRAGPRKGTGLRLAIFRYLHKISRSMQILHLKV